MWQIHRSQTRTRKPWHCESGVLLRDYKCGKSFKLPPGTSNNKPQHFVGNLSKHFTSSLQLIIVAFFRWDVSVICPIVVLKLALQYSLIYIFGHYDQIDLIFSATPKKFGLWAKITGKIKPNLQNIYIDIENVANCALMQYKYPATEEGVKRQKQVRNIFPKARC